MKTCEGACEKHIGDVQQAHVANGGFDWGNFWYCEAAIAEDRKHGHTVTPIQSLVDN